MLSEQLVANHHPLGPLRYKVDSYIIQMNKKKNMVDIITLFSHKI